MLPEPFASEVPERRSGIHTLFVSPDGAKHAGLQIRQQIFSPRCKQPGQELFLLQQLSIMYLSIVNLKNSKRGKAPIFTQPKINLYQP
jgi:hypothetical protein